MASDELLNYIKQVKLQGFKDEEIKSHLLAHGYTKEMVDEALRHLTPPVIPIQTIKVAKPQVSKPKKKKIPVYFHIIVLLIIILLVLRFQVSTENPECEKIKLEVHELSGEKVICSFPDYSKVQMILKNSGEKNIGFVNVKIMNAEKKSIIQVLKELFGMRDESEKIIENLNLLPGDVSTNVVDYGLGKISAIKLTPGILYNRKKYLCESKEISFEEIKSC